jgi:hypothetical protein
MSALPQQKKSPEEIAKLRETLGIPVEAGSSAPEAPEPAVAAPLADTPMPAHPPRARHSLKRAERTVVLPPDPVVVATVPVLEAPEGGVEHLDVPAQPVPVPHAPKPIRSLKRSERMGGPVSPSQVRPVPAESRLPGHRHSDEELAEIRRRAAMAALAEGGHQLPEAAGVPLFVTGYVLAIGGAATPTALKLLAKLMDSYTLGTALGSGYHVLVAGALAALPVAAFIYLKKSLSRHHAAFIAIIAMFALIFAILHYIPQLRYAA